MRHSLRQTLADSHVAAVTIAVLILWSLDGAFRAAWEPVSHMLAFLFTAVAILDIPYFPRMLTPAGRSMLIMAATYLYGAVVSFAAAWLLSQWVYKAGPIRLLATYYNLVRRKRV
jgi:hypothetical protein